MRRKEERGRRIGRRKQVRTDKTEALSFFQYMAVARQKLRELVSRYPEFEQLSTRELEVFAQLLTDKTQEQIADELFISGSSVHFHCKNIYKKLGVSGRRQILIKYKDL